MHKSSISSSEVNEDNIRNFLQLFPFQQIDLQYGFKYLGFHLKPNDYVKIDRGWIIAKVDKRANVW